MSGIPCFGSCVASVLLAWVPVPEDGVEITSLPDISSGMKVSDLLAKPPFNDIKTKIELRLIYDDGGTIKVIEPSVETKDWVVQRYAPGFVKETTSTSSGTITKFDGEDLKKLLRTASMSGGGTFKDKGGAVAVIVKKPASMIFFSLAPAALTGALIGLLLGWWWCGWRHRRRATPV